MAAEQRRLRSLGAVFVVSARAQRDDVLAVFEAVGKDPGCDGVGADQGEEGVDGPHGCSCWREG